MAADATRVVDDLGPLNRAVLWLFKHAKLRQIDFFGESELYHAKKKRKHCRARGDFLFSSGEGISG